MIGRRPDAPARRPPRAGGLLLGAALLTLAGGPGRAGAQAIEPRAPQRAAHEQALTLRDAEAQAQPPPLAALRQDVARRSVRPAAAPTTPLERPGLELRLSGYVQVDALYVPRARPGEPETALVPGRFSDAQNPAPRPRAWLSARDTRLRIEGRLSPAAGVVEIDFHGQAPASPARPGGYQPRLRHAVIELAPSGAPWSLKAGHTWSAFADAEIYGPFYNAVPPGAVFVRQAQLRYDRQLAPSLSAFVSLETPLAEASRVGSAERGGSVEGAPNLVLGLRRNGGSDHLQAAMLLRALRQAGSEATLGWGVTISGARRLRGPFDGVARFQMSGGEGIARYVGELGPRFDGASRGDARPLRVLAGSAHYEHGWTPRWRWAIGASGVDVEGATSAHPAPRRTRAVFANTVFETAEGLDLAAEVVWGEQQAASGRRPRGGLYRLTGRLAF